jgi:aspartokinase-like uncharacterized kinase
MNIDIIVKIGGSLYDLPELGARLGAWLARLETPNLVIVPGGGRTADLVRVWDHEQKLGEEQSHWLALRALTFNAHYLAALLPGSKVIQNLDEAGPKPLRILDMHAWAKAVKRLPDRFPHTWEVTSDSLAVQVAILAKAPQLIMLKSVQLPEGMAWHEAARLGIVDPFFPEAIRLASADLKVRVVHFRDMD